MAVARFLGGAWASVHGPSDPRRLLAWLLEHRFRGLMPGPGPRAVDWPAVHAAAADLPIQFTAVRVNSVLSERSNTGALASANAAEQSGAERVIGEAVRLGRALQCPRIVLEPGLVPILGETVVEDLGDPAANWSREKLGPLLARRKAGLDAALDRACRILFSLCRKFPDVRFCLTPGRNWRTLADRPGLEAIFEDLRGQRLAYWHDTAVVARRAQLLGEAQGGWLEAFSNHMHGCTLGDANQDGLYQAPGAGGVDWALLGSYVHRPRRPMPVVLELDPATSPGELPGVRSFLDKYGL